MSPTTSTAAEHVPSQAFAANSKPGGRDKGKEKYQRYNASVRYQVEEYAAETSNKTAVEKYGVKESTVRSFSTKYLAINKQFVQDTLRANKPATHLLPFSSKK